MLLPRGMSMSTDIRVALIYQQVDASEALRLALVNAGIHIEVDCRAERLDERTLAGSEVDAIVVNLDAELDEMFDRVAEILDTATQPVLYNDPAASSDLSGWDRARWLRHLSVKLKGRGELTPPPPPGAEAIPTPTPRPAAQVPASPAAPVSPDIPGVTAVVNAHPAEEEPVAAAETVQPEEREAGDDVLADLDQLFATPDLAGTGDAAVPAALIVGDADESLLVDIDALFNDSASADAEGGSAMAAGGFGDELGLGLDFESVSGEHGVVPAGDGAPVGGGGQDADLLALDALFEGVDAEPSPELQAAPPSQQQDVEISGDDLALLSMDWSLDSFEESKDQVVGASVDGAVGGAPEGASARTPERSLPEHLQAALSLADLKLVDIGEEAAAEAPDASPPESHPVANTGDALEPLDLGVVDFGADIGLDLDLGEADAALSAAPVRLEQIDLGAELGALSGDSLGASSDLGIDLDDLDALFEPVPVPAPAGLALPDLDRVIVLGASIGGPEGIKAFLARLPASVPAAFVIGQHMGAEFLSMMASQLDAACPLAVRYPQSGERLRHGEVLVAPANERLTIDAEGCVRLSAGASESPYNPSIDQLVRDAVDRFGSRTSLILFSGMGTDALEGGRYLVQHGGQVWAQSPSTCVIASMIEAARAQGLVQFEGSPVELADHLMQSLS